MILLDTHVLIWMALEPSRLSKPASAAIQDARSNGMLCIADITLWEISSLVKRKRIQISGTVDAFLYDISLPLVVKPITPAIARMSEHFAGDYPKDPADRLIGATSQVEGLPLVTADAELRRFPTLHTIW